MPRLIRAEGPQPEDLHLSRRALATGAFSGMIFSGYAAAALAAGAQPITTDSQGFHADYRDSYDAADAQGGGGACRSCSPPMAWRRRPPRRRNRPRGAKKSP